MSKFVRETAAGKSIAAWVIMKGSRKVATVQAHYGNTRVLVNIWQSDLAYLACARKAGIDVSTDSHAAHDAFAFQHASAGGYGYDKLSAALSGLMIDGHYLSDHCSRNGAPKPPKGAQRFPRDFKAPAGYSLANWESYTWENGERVELPDDKKGYRDCYREAGLKYLEMRGYRVIQAI